MTLVSEPKAALTTRLAVLCVDDEPHILEGLTLTLRRIFDVITATSGQNGLEALRLRSDVGIVVSDMRMPGMDGATFLSQVREIAPTTVRLLLTGHTDVNAAVAAVNEGQIFRFLTKPCPPATLIAAMTDAAEQHRLITAERVLLEQTLHGSLKAMADILALASPVMFGRALQVRRHATSLCDTLGIANRWPIEIASLFSQLGLITLPAEVVEKLHGGETLTPDEERMVARTPAVTEELLVQIPRLEAVRAILSTYRRSFDAASAPSPASRAAQLLKVAVDFTDVEARHTAPGTALAILRGRGSAYDPAILDALDATLHSAGVRHEIRELPLSALRVGMVFAEDVMLTTGTMLVARGYEVTERFVARAANFNRGAVREPLRVILPESTSRPS